MFLLNQNKWFTLIEVMIVITIIAILWTISYSGYSSYTITARDSQRKSDIGIINNEIKSISLKWFNLTNLVNTWSVNNTWSWNFFIGWKNISKDMRYKAGWINFDYFKNLTSPLLDPKNRHTYILWIFNNNYEIAGSLEESKTTYLISSYKKRTSSWTITSLGENFDIINNSITLLNKEDAIKFQIWDYIWTWTTQYKEIIDIIWEKIYLDNISGINSIDKIRLFKNDTGIIWNSKAGIWNGVDCNNSLNLKENICPLQENIINLLPYQF